MSKRNSTKCTATRAHRSSFEFQQPDAAAVKGRIHPPSFYATELSAPTPAGTGWVVVRGLCPFHRDRSPGSFAIHTISGAYRCYSCGASGTDVIDFIMKRDGVGFRDALRYLERGW